MKLRMMPRRSSGLEHTLMKFGKGRLVKRSSGKIELVGGTAEDRVAAKEWTSLFLHEATI